MGNCALPLFGWAIARWKWIKVVCTVPAMIMYLTYFITPESPRWLVSQGRMEDAKEVLTKIAKTNGSKVPDDIEVKFGFSEKATNFEKIFVVLFTRASCSVRATAYLSKSRRRFFKTNMVKSISYKL